MKGHKNLHLIANSMMGLLSCLLFFSCNNDDYPIENESVKVSENICFGISSDETSQTRGISVMGNEDGRTVSRFVLRSENSADTLCVRAIVSDGIYSSNLDGRQTVTRGAPVTALDAFHVLAYWQKDGALLNQFFMDESATHNGDVWTTNSIYYWPGAAHTLQFYAYAPANAGFTTPTSSGSTTLANYTVPADVTQQSDIVVANTDALSGDNNQVVPLQFKHICTAVRFVVGSEMQPGTIKDIKLKGVKGSGNYDMSGSQWTLGNTTTDFSQSPDMATDGSTPEGAAITPVAGTFMMLPQTLADGASVEIVFHDNMSNQDRTLTASIAGQEWPMGKTVTYKLSISPEYELEFITEPQEQDAHYVIYPITIKADKVPEGGWTLTSNDTENITFVEKFANDGIKSLVDQGYWLGDNCGTSTLVSSTTGNDVKVYVFLKENISDENRLITLSLAPVNVPNAIPTTFTFSQYCPAWNNNIGVERIQEEDYPWGFNWDSSMNVVYTMPKGLWSGIIHILFEIFGDHTYVKSEGFAISGTWKVTVDFSKVPKLETATSTSDGLTNTWELYNFEGINEASTIMNQLESWGGTPDKTLPSNPSEFAAWACAKKNRYKTDSKTNAGSTIYIPVLEENNLKWYLPAQEEAVLMNDNLSGDYWTSTAITDPGTTAYKYTAGGSTSHEERNNSLHVRAVRKR